MKYTLEMQKETVALFKKYNLLDNGNFSNIRTQNFLRENAKLLELIRARQEFTATCPFKPGDAVKDSSGEIFLVKTIQTNSDKDDVMYWHQVEVINCKGSTFEFEINQLSVFNSQVAELLK